MDSSGKLGGPRQWVIVQLTPTGEREERISVLSNSVNRILKHKLEVFIPAISQTAREDSHTIAFMEGYIFVEYREDVPYLRLNETTFFSTVLCNSQRGGDRSPRYSLLDDTQLNPLREGMDNLKYGDFCIGDAVKVIKGSYKNLRGRVTSIMEDGDRGQIVQITRDLLSKPLLLAFPITYLEKIDE
jgi:hypothetical protein